MAEPPALPQPVEARRVGPSQRVAPGHRHSLPLVHPEEALVEVYDAGVVELGQGQRAVGGRQGGGGAVHATGLEDELGLKKNGFIVSV